MPHKFDVSRASILEDEERKKFLPPVVILRRIGVKEGVSFADIGCGTGYFAIPAASLVGKGKVYAIDIQKGMLEMLKERAGYVDNIVPVRSTEDRIPLPGECVDIVFMGVVLHELEGMGTLREAYRILREGGILGVVEWKKEPMDTGPPLEDRLSFEEAKKKIEEVGFVVIEGYEVPPYHYALRARKD